MMVRMIIAALLLVQPATGQVPVDPVREPPRMAAPAQDEEPLLGDVPQPHTAQPAAPPAASEPQTPGAAGDSASNEGSRVVRGTPVAAGQAPWQVQIYATGEITAEQIAIDAALPNNSLEKQFLAGRSSEELNHLCGGALIAPDWAISAAHCFVDGNDNLRPEGSRRVRLGSNNLRAATQMSIDKVIVHGLYRKKDSARHDIALIHLVADAATNRAVRAGTRPVPLVAATAPPVRPSDPLIVTGWGITGQNEQGSTRDVNDQVLRMSLNLLEGLLGIVDAGECARIPQLRRTVWDGVMCLRGTQNQQDSCQGDSGGPVTRYNVLVGVVSTGFGCGLPGVAAIYTRVSTYSRWIRAVMAAPPSQPVARCTLGTALAPAQRVARGARQETTRETSRGARQPLTQAQTTPRPQRAQLQPARLTCA